MSDDLEKRAEEFRTKCQNEIRMAYAMIARLSAPSQLGAPRFEWNDVTAAEFARQVLADAASKPEERKTGHSTWKQVKERLDAKEEAEREQSSPDDGDLAVDVDGL